MNKLEILLEKTDFEKIAYPNNGYQDPQPKFDLNKWVLSMQKIKQMQSSGLDKFAAVDKITQGWSVVELDNFLNWMKFYENGDHLKYKYASLYSSPENPGYYLNSNNKEFVADFRKPQEEDEEQIEDNKEERLALLKKKFLSRLSSMEKLLNSNDADEFLKKDVDELINVIYELKKKFLKLKLASNYSIHDELIFQANKLRKNNNVYEFLNKFAQAMAPGAQPNPPTQVSGSPSALPATAVGNTPPPNNPPIPDISDPAEIKDNAGEEFTSKLKGKLDVNEVKDDEIIFVSEAQVQPVVQKPVENPQQLPAEQKPIVNDYDNKIDSLFKDVKITDVVDKLDSLSSIFKEREIPRQLAIIDMMLNALNLSHMFPGLSESHNKALESNNYILTRVDDILSKLRGSIKTEPMSLTPDKEKSLDPQAAAIRENLEKEEEANKKRKELKKQVENEALDKMNEVPEIEVSDQPTPAPVTEPQSTPVSIPK